MATKTLAKLLLDYEDRVYMGDKPREYKYYPSGVMGLDIALGDKRGLRSGTIAQIVGDKSAGKTKLAMTYIATNQKLGNLKEIEVPINKKETRVINALLVDIERSYDKEYAEMLGIDTSKLFVIKPKYIENAFDIIRSLLEEGLQLIVIDSIPMVVPKAEDGKSFDDNENVRAAAQLIGRTFKQFIGLVDDADGLILVLNQFRANTNPMSPKQKDHYGARSLHHAVKVTIELARTGNEKGMAEVKAFIEKNKQGGIERSQWVYYMTYTGPIRTDYDILTLGLDYGILTGRGQWTYYNDANGEVIAKGQGKEKAVKNINMEEIRQKLLAMDLKAATEFIEIEDEEDE